MIDRIYAHYSLRHEKPLDPNYKPIDSIISYKFYNPHAKKLCVVLPGWHNHPSGFPINKLTKRLIKKGWAVLVYDFHDQIIEPHEDTVVESFKYIRQKVAKDIKGIAAKYNYDEVNLTGISLGVVAWALVVDTYTDFTSATIVVGGDDLAVDMWHGLRTQHYRKAFEKLHVGIHKLDKQWEGIAPANHLKHLKDKRVKMVMSLTDKFILTKYQKRLYKRLIENGAEVRVSRSPFGHAMSIVIFCLFDSPL